SNKAPLFVSHCRFVSAGAVDQIWLSRTPQFDLRHSLLLGPTYIHVGIEVPERGRHELTNNLLLGADSVGPGPVHFMEVLQVLPKDYRLSPQGNTIAGTASSIEARFWLKVKGPLPAKQPLQIRSTVNVLGGSRSDLYLHDSRGPEDRMTAEEIEAVGKR